MSGVGPPGSPALTAAPSGARPPCRPSATAELALSVGFPAWGGGFPPQAVTHPGWLPCHGGAPPASCLTHRSARPPLELAPELLLPLQDGHVQLAPLLLHVQRVVARGHLELACLHRSLWAGLLSGLGQQATRAPARTTWLEQPWFPLGGEARLAGGARRPPAPGQPPHLQGLVDALGPVLVRLLGWELRLLKLQELAPQDLWA